MQPAALYAAIERLPGRQARIGPLGRSGASPEYGTRGATATRWPSAVRALSGSVAAEALEDDPVAAGRPAQVDDLRSAGPEREPAGARAVASRDEEIRVPVAVSRE